jgi:hypothetical protein
VEVHHRQSRSPRVGAAREAEAAAGEGQPHRLGKAARAAAEEEQVRRREEEAQGAEEGEQARRYEDAALAVPAVGAPRSRRAARETPQAEREGHGASFRACAAQAVLALARAGVCRLPVRRRAGRMPASRRSTRPESTSHSPRQRGRASRRGWLPTHPRCPFRA